MSRLRRLVVAALLVLPLLAGCQEAAVEPERQPGAEPAPPTDARSSGSELPSVLAEAVEDGPRRPDTPRQVVRALTVAHDALRVRGAPRQVYAAAGHLQQLAIRELADRSGWDERVLADLPRRMRAAVRRDVASRREFRALHSGLGDTLPAWRIVRPPGPELLKRHYLRAERAFGVDWEYLAAINLIETAMGRIRGTSVAGAQGPMQFIPATWEIYGRGDITSYRDSIMAAGRYLADRGFTEPGGIPGALYSYNNSQRYVRGVTLVAENIRADPRAYLGYHHWQVYFTTERGDVLLPVGYSAQEPIPVDRYLRRHPQR